MVAKLPAVGGASRATALALRSYENEVRLYQELAPDLTVRTPRLFHADIDVTTADFVLLLEDLAPARTGLVMAISAAMLVAQTDRGDQMFLTMAERHARHALDLDAIEVIVVS